MWYNDLAKGRGVDERYAEIAHVVANDLLQQQLLIFKTSQGKKKYALNPARTPEVHAVANVGTFLESAARSNPHGGHAGGVGLPSERAAFSAKVS